MGKQKYQDKIQKLFKESPIVTHKSIEKIMQKNNNQYAKQLIKNLIKKNKIKKLCKGVYTSYNESSLAVFCYTPSYLGLQDALSFHNLWEQETIPIIITSKKVRTGIKKSLDSNILIRKINKKYLFGFDYSQQDNYALPYSDIEKTFIDMIYFKQPISKEVLIEIKRRINKSKFKDYLKKYPKRFKDKVLKIINSF